MVRLGTAGAMQEYTRVGDSVIATGAVRQEGITTVYANGVSAVSSHDMTSALEKAVKASEGKYHLELFSQNTLRTT